MKTLKFKSLKDIPKLEAIGVSIEFEPLECDVAIEGSFDNDETSEKIKKSYNSGNYAAWFTAKVTVKYKEFEEEDYLGGCSYRSFKDFTGEKNGYYGDMISTCIERINNEIADYNTLICRRWAIRKAKNLIAPYGLFIVSTKEISERSLNFRFYRRHE